MSEVELLQPVFDRAVAGLASQSFVRCTEEGKCLYEAPNGMRCGVGHVVHDIDVLHEHGLISCGIWAVVEARPEVLEDIFGLELDEVPTWAVDFLSALQGAHDAGYEPEHMKQSLVDLGKRYGLEIPEVLSAAA